MCALTDMALSELGLSSVHVCNVWFRTVMAAFHTHSSRPFAHRVFSLLRGFERAHKQEDKFARG